jgi:hypothetical protein
MLRILYWGLNTFFVGLYRYDRSFGSRTTREEVQEAKKARNRIPVKKDEVLIDKCPVFMVLCI